MHSQLLQRKTQDASALERKALATVMTHRFRSGLVSNLWDPATAAKAVCILRQQLCGGDGKNICTCIDDFCYVIYPRLSNMINAERGSDEKKERERFQRGNNDHHNENSLLRILSRLVEKKKRDNQIERMDTALNHFQASNYLI